MIAFDDGTSKVVKVFLDDKPSKKARYRLTRNSLCIATNLLTPPTGVVNPTGRTLYFSTSYPGLIEGDSYEAALQLMLCNIKVPFTISAAMTLGRPNPVGMTSVKLQSDVPILALSPDGWRKNF